MVRQKGILSSQEVADMLGVELNYLYFLRRTSQLLPIEQNSIMKKPRLQYRRADVEKFLAEREQDKESHSRSKIVA